MAARRAAAVLVSGTSTGVTGDMFGEGSTISVSMIWRRVPFERQATGSGLRGWNVRLTLNLTGAGSSVRKSFVMTIRDTGDRETPGAGIVRKQGISGGLQLNLFFRGIAHG